MIFFRPYTCVYGFFFVPLRAQNGLCMRYTRNQLNKIGSYLYADGVDAFQRSEAIRIVSDWRMTHLLPLREFVEQITSYFAKESVFYAFYSQRIKRMTSIIEKLQVNESTGMRLGGLQDIGGARFVFDTLDELTECQKALSAFVPEHFELEKVNDYIVNPKESGYRSIHYVYKYHSANIDYDGLRIELQIRTRLEHSWAMAVETASLISRTSLKANIEDHSVWREFFKLVSAIFAQKEACPVNVRYAGYTHERYCADYLEYLDKHKLLYQLQALRVTVSDEDTFASVNNGYCLLLINFRMRIVTPRIYPLEQEDAASAMFSQTEQSLNEDEAVILVSIEKMQELREAYPSYFLDTKEFLLALKEFNDSCAVYRKQMING